MPYCHAWTDLLIDAPLAFSLFRVHEDFMLVCLCYCEQTNNVIVYPTVPVSQALTHHQCQISS